MAGDWGNGQATAANLIKSAQQRDNAKKSTVKSMENGRKVNVPKHSE